MVSTEKLCGSKYVEQTTIQESKWVFIYNLWYVLNIACPSWDRLWNRQRDVSCATVCFNGINWCASNQRIENWWSHNKRLYMAWVIDHFKSLVYKGKYHLGNYFHKECAWYVYSIYLEQELDTVEIE